MDMQRDMREIVLEIDQFQVTTLQDNNQRASFEAWLWKLEVVVVVLTHFIEMNQNKYQSSKLLAKN